MKENLSNLLYFDVEYANSKNKSICQIGLMIEDAITKDPTYPELELLINPNDEFDNRCISVHHITPEQVKDSKSFSDVWKDIEKYFIKSIIVGHNVASSDLDALCKNLIRNNLSLPELYYVDTLEIAKDHLSPVEVENFSLSCLCNYLDVDMGEEHNAFDDACACSDLLNVLIETFDVDLNDYVRYYDFDKDYSFSPFFNSLSLTREINTLLGKVKGILSDGNIDEKEIEYLNNWLNTNRNYDNDENGKKIIDVLEEILDDNVITLEEGNRLHNLLINITQNLSASIETRATQILQGIIEGIKVDSKLEDKEIYSIQKWLYENDYLIGHFPYDKIKSAVDSVLEDKIITEDGKQYLLSLFDDIFNPIKDATCNAIDFEGKEFVLSGDFCHGTKKNVEEYISSKGGTINSNVRKKTNYLVVGGLGSASYSNGTYGGKVKKAMEIGVAVLTEKQLYDEI